MIGGTVGIVLILSSWVIVASALTGLGMGLRWRFDNQAPEVDDLFLCFWLGFAATLVLLQLWHCFYAIDIRVAAIILAIGCAGHLVTRGAAFRTVASLARDVRPWFLAVLIAASVWVANNATAAPQLFDSGNYHLPVVHWVTTYPIVKGLGNVDGLLGLNNASLLYQGMLEVGFWQRRSSHIGNGVLLLALLLFGLYKLYRGATTRRFSLPSLFAALTLTAVVHTIDDVSSPGTDLPSLLLMLVIAYFLIDASESFFSEPAPMAPPAAAFRLLACVLLCAVALTIKLSAAVYGLAVCLALLALWLGKRELRSPYRIRVAAASLLIVLCTVLLWAGRSVILTGYPLFPSLAIAFRVPWRVPDVYAEWYQWWIATFARMPYNDAISGEGFGWIPPWITVELRKAKIAGILPLSLSAVALIYLGAGKKGREWLRRLLPAWIPLLLALAAWFGSAPSFRFGEALLWILAGQCLALSVTKLVNDRPRRLSLAVAAICVLPFSAIFMHAFGLKQSEHVNILTALAASLWTRPGPDYGMYPVHESPVRMVLTEGGVTAFEPRMRPPCGDYAWADCVMWYGPLPNAQRLKSALGYLSGSDPGDGFKIAETRQEWLARHAAEVRDQRKNMNIRQMAFYFQVAPKTIRLALEPGVIGKSGIPGGSQR